jgi:hydroxymethylpyrimidine pyrophosphatase-like HAD family hydrolase
VLNFLNNETSAQTIYENDLPVGVVAASDQEMDRVVAYLDESRSPESLFHYQRNTIYLRFCHAHYSKGAALAELCRLTGISADETFAAGDHYNDLSMLDGRYAKWPCAPGNAIESVKETVRGAGGYIAEAGYSHGVAEGLHHYFRQHGKPLQVA